MSDEARITITGLPHPLRTFYPAGSSSAPGSSSPPESWRLMDDGGLSISAGPRTDWFIDPDGGPVIDNAPALLMPTSGPWMLSAAVTAEHAATYDAAVLVVRHSERRWAKLCLERSPQGQVMVVSVVTRDTSDDCNSLPIELSPVHLRISRLAHAYAFHYSTDGSFWHLVRYFSLGTDEDPELGFLAQSPTGQGCTAEFRRIRFSPDKLGDVRSGI